MRIFQGLAAVAFWSAYNLNQWFGPLSVVALGGAAPAIVVWFLIAVVVFAPLYVIDRRNSITVTQGE